MPLFSPVEEKTRIQQLVKLYGQNVEFGQIVMSADNSSATGTMKVEEAQRGLDAQQGGEGEYSVASWAGPKESVVQVKPYSW